MDDFRNNHKVKLPSYFSNSTPSSVVDIENCFRNIDENPVFQSSDGLSPTPQKLFQRKTTKNTGSLGQMCR